MKLRKTPYFAPPEECRRCPYATPCVTPPPTGQKGSKIAPTIIFDCVYRGLVPKGSIRQMLEDLQTQVRSAADARYGPGSSAKLSGGIQKVRGDWLEYILGVIFWNTAAASEFEDTAILRLPNATQLRFHDLYEPQAKGYLNELHDSLIKHGIYLIMSNPDFICVTGIQKSVAKKLSTPLTMGEASVLTMEMAYQKIKERCNADSIPFALTVKSSIRPDRRYQIVHEANTVKALVAHLAGRFWKRNMYTAFYAMVASHVSNADRKVLRNPATHTLVHVSWIPAPVVDKVFEIDSAEEVASVISDLLNTHLG